MFKNIRSSFLFWSYILLTSSLAWSQGVLIGDTAQQPHNSAILELRSNQNGFLLPRLTTAQRNAISNPAIGLQIYNLTTECFEAYHASVGWQAYGCACVSAPAQPGPITGFNSVCQNQQNVTYTINPVAGANSYTWNVPPGASIVSGVGTTSIIVNFGTSSGDVTVSASNNCGTSSSTALNVAVANPSSAFTSPSFIAVNGPATFNATQSGLTYAWTFQNGSITSSTLQNPTVTWTSAGTYAVSLTVTSPSGCTSTTTSNVSVSSCLTGGSTNFSATGTIQNWTVPAGVCSITIEAWGAQGGNNRQGNRNGGLGAYVKGTFAVTGGTQLRIIVGSQGQPGVNTTFGAGSGGGASAVSIVGQSAPLIVAGGGGGAGGVQGTYHHGGDAPNSQNGGNANPGGPSQGGINGNGGTGGIGHQHCGAAGGGWFTAGTGTVSEASNGQALSGTAAGGNGGPYGIAGGFGGGGGSNIAGGGGGGYGGGAGGDQTTGWIEYGGGGGGSFNSGTNQSITPGTRTGNGSIVITW